MKKEVFTLKKADIVLMSNAVFTGLSKEPMPGCVAIKGEKIIGIGDKNEVNNYIDFKRGYRISKKASSNVYFKKTNFCRIKAVY